LGRPELGLSCFYSAPLCSILIQISSKPWENSSEGNLTDETEPAFVSGTGGCLYGGKRSRFAVWWICLSALNRKCGGYGKLDTAPGSF